MVHALRARALEKWARAHKFHTACVLVDMKQIHFISLVTRGAKYSGSLSSYWFMACVPNSSVYVVKLQGQATSRLQFNVAFQYLPYSSSNNMKIASPLQHSNIKIQQHQDCNSTSCSQIHVKRRATQIHQCSISIHAGMGTYKRQLSCIILYAIKCQHQSTSNIKVSKLPCNAIHWHHGNTYKQQHMIESSINPKPQTLNPKPWTLNPKP